MLALFKSLHLQEFITLEHKTESHKGGTPGLRTSTPMHARPIPVGAGGRGGGAVDWQADQLQAQKRR